MSDDGPKSVIPGTIVDKIRACLDVSDRFEQQRLAEAKRAKEYKTYLEAFLWDTDVLRLFDHLMKHSDLYKAADPAIPGLCYLEDNAINGIALEVPKQNYSLIYLQAPLKEDSSVNLHKPRIDFATLSGIDKHKRTEYSIITVDGVMTSLFPTTDLKAAQAELELTIKKVAESCHVILSKYLKP